MRWWGRTDAAQMVDLVTTPTCTINLAAGKQTMGRVEVASKGYAANPQ